MSIHHYLPPASGVLPDWLFSEPKSANHKRKQRYYLNLYQATPPWVPRLAILEIYRQSKRLRAKGCKVSVDHVVPLSHPMVCGLHVPWNLEIVDEDYNQFKANNFWPGCYFAQLEMFDNVKAEQYELQI